MTGRRRSGGGRRGPLGLREGYEPEIRRLTAMQLGIPAAWLRPGVSFSQDLGATVTDVAELAVGLERELGVYLPERALDGVRTYGDFVDAVIAAHGDDAEPPPAVLLRATLVPARRDRHGIVARVVQSSPYELETLVDDARRAGPGACLVLTMPVGTPVETLEDVERRLARLASREVAVRVCQDEPRGREVA